MKISGNSAGLAAIQVVAQDILESPHSDSDAARTSRAVVPVKPIETEKSLTIPARRGSAPFLAQLIATERQLPQTRERRRAAPREAIAAYGAAIARLKFR